MFGRIKKWGSLSVLNLGLIFSLMPSLAAADDDRRECYQRWVESLPQEDHCHNERLAFGLNAIVFLSSPEAFAGVAEARVFNPHGKETFLGAITFDSPGSDDTISLSFPLTAVKHSKDFGEYKVVLDIYTNSSSLSPIEMIGNVAVLKEGALTSLGIFDIDVFPINASNFQVTALYYNHARPLPR